ncbi:hypothetical protein [Thermodesulfitimonas autotrophica]|uniref:hypothetical protein n=1 Tax=Thermodesulfitimonas autotrophica TaxID=1894989 RepID=UPI002FE38EC1
MPKLIKPERAIETVLGDLLWERRLRLRRAVHPHYYMYMRVGHQPLRLGFDFHWRDEWWVWKGLKLRNRSPGDPGVEEEFRKRYAHSFNVWLGTNTWTVNLSEIAGNWTFKNWFATQEELEERLHAVRRVLLSSGLADREQTPGTSPSPKFPEPDHRWQGPGYQSPHPL